MFAPKHIMDYESSSSSDGHEAAPRFSNFPWNDIYFQEKYSYEVSLALEELNCMIPVNNTVKAVSEEINTLCNSLCHVLKESATKVMSKCPTVTKKKSKLKQWWNQDE